ncbi:VOC family protein [Vibrio natriegens]|uniref:VOC family protein n=1 Tax=Vibrio TaxID=662 RepID=UPI000804787F|nr:MULTISPECIES: VOC family protein [Vibrio]ANQ26544.1 glyoxalase [Vibrio natriegens]MCY9878902.1 VOC family protein [Vibrio natriegens]MDV6251230.1 VOC family protein [Vibrio sp. EA2]
MFSHVMVGSNDVDKSKQFYDAILSVLGYQEGVLDPHGRCFYFHPEGTFAITAPIDGEAATSGNGMTIGFKVDSPELVELWHKAGLESGGVECEDPPGVRTMGPREMYLAYLRDPAGNKLCATHIMA